MLWLTAHKYHMQVQNPVQCIYGRYERHHRCCPISMQLSPYNYNQKDKPGDPLFWRSHQRASCCDHTIPAPCLFQSKPMLTNDEPCIDPGWFSTILHPTEWRGHNP